MIRDYIKSDSADEKIVPWIHSIMEEILHDILKVRMLESKRIFLVGWNFRQQVTRRKERDHTSDLESCD